VRARKLREFADGERIATDAAFAVVCERAHGEQRSRFLMTGSRARARCSDIYRDEFHSFRLSFAY
jgi:hypothetical protein